MNARQQRMRVELKKLLKRGVPAAKAMGLAWKRTPKNPRRRRNAEERRCKLCGSPTLYKSGVCRWCQEKMGRKPGPNPRRCGVKYAHGVINRWCDRKRGHVGPHSGNLRRNPLTRTKAREILHHGEVGGRPLTEAQRRLFGAKASGSTLREYPALNPPPVKLYANGQLIGAVGFRPATGRRRVNTPRIDIRV